MQRIGPRTERGAAAVEFALVVPILAMLVLGIFTIGLAYSNHIAISNAVREGARLGASAPANASWASSVISQTNEVYADASNPLDSGDVCAAMYRKKSDGTIVQVSTTGNVTGCAKEPSAPANIPAGCFVKVWANHRASLSWLLGGATVTLHAQSVSIYNRSSSCPTS